MLQLDVEIEGNVAAVLLVAFIIWTDEELFYLLGCASIFLFVALAERHLQLLLQLLGGKVQFTSMSSVSSLNFEFKTCSSFTFFTASSFKM